jgi:hypothetical protein
LFSYQVSISTFNLRDYLGTIDLFYLAEVDLINGIAMVPPPPPATQDGRSRLSTRMRSAEVAQEIDIDMSSFCFEEHTVDHTAYEGQYDVEEHMR